jgi:hypothetical protein
MKNGDCTSPVSLIETDVNTDWIDPGVVVDFTDMSSKLVDFTPTNLDITLTVNSKPSPPVFMDKS